MTRIDRSRLPDVGVDPRFVFPSIVRHTLGNGLRVCTVEHHNVPIITLNLQVAGGSGADPEGLEGLAALVADMADEGTGTLSALVTVQVAAETFAADKKIPTRQISNPTAFFVFPTDAVFRSGSANVRSF